VSLRYPGMAKCEPLLGAGSLQLTGMQQKGRRLVAGSRLGWWIQHGLHADSPEGAVGVECQDNEPVGSGSCAHSGACGRVHAVPVYNHQWDESHTTTPDECAAAAGTEAGMQLGRDVGSVPCAFEARLRVLD
jgi:hypothetical protein